MYVVYLMGKVLPSLLMQAKEVRTACQWATLSTLTHTRPITHMAPPSPTPYLGPASTQGGEHFAAAG